jgi:hypothetical protein
MLTLCLAIMIALFACISAAGAALSITPTEAHVGDTITISGTTAFSPGNQVLVEVQSASFTATNKSDNSGFSGISGVVPVVKDAPYNRWTFTFDTSTIRPDTYLVRVEVLETTAIETTSFVLLPRPQATEATTTVSTPVPTTTMPATTTTAPPTTTPDAGVSAPLLVAVVVGLFVLSYGRTRAR